MDKLFNTTGSHQSYNQGIMVGGNFIDILLRHIMEGGWESVSLMALMNFYIYLSMDKIKDLFKYINDKLGENLQYYTEHYVSLAKNYLEDYSNIWLERIKKETFNFVCKIKNYNKVQEPEPVVIKKEILPIEPKNTMNLKLNQENKTDILAIAHLIVYNRSELKINNYYRTSSDKTKAIEVYTLPEKITFDYDLIKNNNLISLNNLVVSTDIKITFSQTLSLTLLLEIDNNSETLKDVKLATTADDVCEIRWRDFKYLATKLTSPTEYDHSFRSAALDHYAGPGELCDEYCDAIIFMLYYTKNFSLFRKFCSFLFGKSEFYFDGKKYKLLGDASLDCSKNLDNKEKLEEFIKELVVYIDEKLYPDCSSNKSTIDAWISKSKHLIDPSPEYADGITLIFESNQMSQNDLSKYSRYFINELIINYYQHDSKNTLNNIPVYNLSIKYNIEKIKKENPEYIIWKENFDTVDKKDQVENKEKSNGVQNTSKNDQSGEKGEIHKKDGIQNLDHNKYHNQDTQYIPNHFYNYGFRHKPAEFIEQEVKIPFAESEHVRTCQKPFRYLYLKKSQKQLLESYLTNFKENKEIYQKFGFCHKGGILLSGEPGCGKSTTIMAIATFLGKNIYYLDLGKIKTNNELKLCMDYVKTTSKKGGVIIFEDIDCMNPIFLARNYSEPGPVTDTLSDKLSLSYILNILDGTMSLEDIIFVMTTNHKDKLDSALIRPGRMDINLKIEKCDKYQLQQIFFDIYEKNISEEILERFIENNFITAEVIMHLFHNIYNTTISQEDLLCQFLRKN